MIGPVKPQGLSTPSESEKRFARSETILKLFIPREKRKAASEMRFTNNNIWVRSLTGNVNTKVTLLINGLILVISNPHSFGTNFGHSEFLSFF